MGEGNRSAIGTLVERSTRNVVLVHLPHGRTAAAVRDALIDVFTDLPPALRRSLTWDQVQGKESQRPCRLTRAVGMPVFFCQPHSPCERGSNENTGFSVTTSPRAATPTTAWPKSPPNSTTARARPSAGPAQRDCSRLTSNLSSSG